ncbi:hypothetical protein JCGZ_23205 [Jatropha curcas]|uniref:Uncharacterized protein n=1 Tax=Jatropha curcas TaxID=180498 RepID=A0A067JHN3_JATCU|nr:hypothetical protein JCGZ_23205 [Jatropha curcas]
MNGAAPNQMNGAAPNQMNGAAANQRNGAASNRRNGGAANQKRGAVIERNGANNRPIPVYYKPIEEVETYELCTLDRHAFENFRELDAEIDEIIEFVFDDEPIPVDVKFVGLSEEQLNPNQIQWESFIYRLNYIRLVIVEQ